MIVPEGGLRSGGSSRVETKTFLQQGISAARAGDLTRASVLLARVVQADPQSVEGWWWLGQVLSDPAQSMYCFRQALKLDPHHEGARAGIARFGPPQTPHRVPAPEPGPPSEAIHAPAGSSSESSPPPAGSTPPQPRPRARAARASTLGLALGLLFAASLVAALAYFGVLERIAASLAPYLPVQPTPRELGALPTIELGPTWTPTCTPTPRPPTATPTLTATPGFEERRLKAMADIERAYALMEEEDYAQAVLAWDTVLRQLPEYGEGYYARARAYLNLTGNQRSEDEYRDYLHRALEDVNRAMALEHFVTGDHYYSWYEIYDALANIEPLRVDRDPLFELALENLRMAVALGNTFQDSEREIPFTLISLGRCQEAIDETQTLIQARGPGAPPSAGLNSALTGAYLCMGQLSRALQHAEIAIEAHDEPGRRYDRAFIFYNLGRLQDALDEINQLIEDDPYYGGYRYYLRALIFYDLGMTDEALDDILFGSSQTWGHSGLYSYVLGRIDLDAGNIEAGIEQLQYAEATLGEGFGPVLDRVRRELAGLDAQPLRLTPSARVTATPMATPLPTITSRPLSLRVTATPDRAQTVDMAMGTGPIALRSLDCCARIFRFQPAAPIRFASVVSLTVFLQPMPVSEEASLTMFLWPADAPEQPWTVQTGEVEIPVPGPYVTRDGDIFVGVRSLEDETIYLDNMAVQIVVALADGSHAAYGYQAEQVAVAPDPDRVPAPGPPQALDYTTTLEPLRLAPGEVITLQYSLPALVAYESVGALGLRLRGSDETRPLTMWIYPWIEAQRMGEAIEAQWGWPTIDQPERFVSAEGKFVVTLWNWGEEPLQVDYFGTAIVVETSDGSLMRFGYAVQ